MRVFFAGALIAIAPLFSSTHAGAADAGRPDLRAVLDASGKAVGAEHALTQRAWLERARGTAAGLNGTFDLWIDRLGDAEATYAHLPPLSQDNGYDGGVVWTRDDKGVVWVDGSVAGRSAAINSLYRDTDALWTPNRGGARVELVGRRTSGNTAYDVVRVTPPNSAAPFEYWFSATTHLPERVVEAIGPVTTATTLSDYRRVGGMRIAYSQNSRDTQGNVTDLTLSEVAIDPNGALAAVRKPPSTVHDFSIAGGDRTTVPFDLIDNHVYLNVMLNGKGPYRVIFDTGGANLVDPAVVREIGATAVGSMQGSGVGAATESSRFARVASLRVGAAELRDQLFLVLPVRAGFGVSGSAPVDGLIGWEVLARILTTFDYGASRVTLQMPPAANVTAGGTSTAGTSTAGTSTAGTGTAGTSTAGTSAAGTSTAGASDKATRTKLPGKVTRFVFGGTQPELPCSIDGIATTCAVDTGSRSAIDVFSPFIAAHPQVVPANASAPGLNGYGVGGGDVGRLGRLTSLQLGGYDLKDVIAGFSTAKRGAFANIGIGGNVGGTIWKRFTVTFDYPDYAMSLVPNGAFNAPYEYDRSGIFAIDHGGRLVAIDVRPGTPAAAAGIKKGDVIAIADGKSGADLTLAALRAALRQPAGTVVHLGIVSPGTTSARNVTLTLRNYV